MSLTVAQNLDTVPVTSLQCPFPFNGGCEHVIVAMNERDVDDQTATHLIEDHGYDWSAAHTEASRALSRIPRTPVSAPLADTTKHGAADALAHVAKVLSYEMSTDVLDGYISDAQAAPLNAYNRDYLAAITSLHGLLGK